MPDQPAFILVHSPLVGSMTWQSAAARLRLLGHPAVVPSLRVVIDGGPPFHMRLADEVARSMDAVDSSHALVVVVHSGAGALVPAIIAASRRPVAVTLFVDASLPHPGQAWLDTAPPTLREHLRGLVVDGELPPWNHWFPPEALAAELPDEQLRAQFIADLPRLKMSYFEERAPLVTGWEPARSGYLQWTQSYANAANEANQLGWLTSREAATHLAMLTTPDQVVDALLRLVARLV